jgi:site-specific recombinase XerD
MQIIIKISAQGSSLIRTGIFVDDSEWDDTNKVVVKHPEAKIYNRSLMIKTGQIDAVFSHLFLQKRLDTLTATQIKEIIDKGESSETVANKDEDNKNAYFFAFAQKIVSAISKEKTKVIYSGTIDKIRQFCIKEHKNDLLFTSNKIGEAGEKLTFNDINIPFLKGFDKYMEGENLKINSRSVHLRNLRKLYNDAIDANKASLEVYPFRRYKIKQEATLKRNLKIDELVEFRDFKCEPHQQQYVDMFFLGFYLIGINMIDLCNLKKITKDGRIEFCREKTGRLYSIKVEPEAMELINKYKGEKYLINVLDRYKNHADYLHRLGNNLKEVGTIKIGKHGKKTHQPLQPDISWYYARHTWATIASKLDISKDVIAAALGHGATTTTDIYIDFDQRKVDDANRKVLDYVNAYKRDKPSV